MLLVLVASPPDAPKPTKFDQFVAASARAARTAPAQTPDSFDDEDYHGIKCICLLLTDIYQGNRI